MLDRSFNVSDSMISQLALHGEGDANRSALLEEELIRSECQAQIAIEKMSRIARQPIDITILKKRMQMLKTVRLSTLAKKNPNFKLSAYQTIHKAKLSERLMKTLERNDVDRPKRIREKYDIFRYYEPNLVNVPEVKNTMRDELKRRKHDTYVKQVESRHNYIELLEYVHSRYDPKRRDNPIKAVEVNAIDAKLISEHKVLRLPVELERRFFEILYVIIEDNWELPSGKQWVELLEYLNAFNADS